MLAAMQTGVTKLGQGTACRAQVRPGGGDEENERMGWSRELTGLNSKENMKSLGSY